MPSLLDHSVVSSTIRNMNTKSFYVKKLTSVTTLEEVNDIVEASDHVLSVVVLPPEAGDSPDEEDINDNLDDAFEPARQLEVEKETDEESDHETAKYRCRWLD